MTPRMIMHWLMVFSPIHHRLLIDLCQTTIHKVHISSIWYYPRAITLLQRNHYYPVGCSANVPTMTNLPKKSRGPVSAPARVINDPGQHLSPPAPARADAGVIPASAASFPAGGGGGDTAPAPPPIHPAVPNTIWAFPGRRRGAFSESAPRNAPR